MSKLRDKQWKIISLLKANKGQATTSNILIYIRQSKKDMNSERKHKGPTEEIKYISKKNTISYKQSMPI